MCEKLPAYWRKHLALLGGSDLYPAVAYPGLVAGLGEDGRTVYGLAATQVEARVVPGTDHGVTLAVALLKRPPEVAADAGDCADLATQGAAEQDRCPISFDPAHAVLRQLSFVQNRGELIGTASLEDVPVNAEAVMVGELPADVGGQTADGVPGQETQTPGVPAPGGSQNERGDDEDERNRVQEPVRHAHSPGPAAQVA